MELYQKYRLDIKHIGRKTGKWVQLGPSFNCGEHARRAVCECSCGNVSAVKIGSLNSGKSSRCEACRIGDFSRKKHGLSKCPEYGVWQNMILRCENPRSKSYGCYGGRGISVCDRWRESVLNFYADMGPRPSSGYELDRIDNDGNYEPGNCRWITKLANIKNKPSTRTVVFNNRSMTITEFSKAIGIKRGTVAFRLDHGWTVDEIAAVAPFRGRNSRA